MKKTELIPAIDLIGGKCVRLVQGDYSRKTIYADDPLTVALQFETLGIKRLHLVDLDGAKAGELKNIAVLEKIATQTKLQIDFGGGVKTTADVQRIIDAGAALVTIGSIAVKAPETVFGWLEDFGAVRFFLGADVRNEQVAIHGWLEQTEMAVFDLLEIYSKRGLKNVFCTDIAKDGLLEGPSTALYKKILQQCPGINLTASGGVSCMADVFELQEAGCSGVIIGKAIYEGKITNQELEQFLKNETC